MHPIGVYEGGQVGQEAGREKGRDGLDRGGNIFLLCLTVSALSVYLFIKRCIVFFFAWPKQLPVPRNNVHERRTMHVVRINLPPSKPTSTDHARKLGIGLVGRCKDLANSQ